MVRLFKRLICMLIVYIAYFTYIYNYNSLNYINKKIDNGKLIEKWGRKATGLSVLAYDGWVTKSFISVYIYVFTNVYLLCF